MATPVAGRAENLICSRGRNFEVGGRSCATGRDLSGFDLDKGSTSSGRVELGLGLEVLEFVN